MSRKYFGTDGIRGRTNAGAMTAEMAMKVGQAAGAHFLRGDHKHRVVIGKDTRLSGYMIENALGRWFYQRRHGCGAVWADTDTCGGAAHPFDAR